MVCLGCKHTLTSQGPKCPKPDVRINIGLSDVRIFGNPLQRRRPLRANMEHSLDFILFQTVDFVSRMLVKAGRTEVLVGLHRVRPKDSRLAHLYRFIWQQGEKGLFAENQYIY